MAAEQKKGEDKEDFENLLKSVGEASNKNKQLLKRLEKLEGKSSKEHAALLQELIGVVRDTYGACWKLQQDLDKQDQSPTKSKQSFRLTPEEQEIAYELKASMMRKLEGANAQLQTEIELQKSQKNLSKQNQRNTVVRHDEMLSRVNAVKLMRLYEKKCKEAEAQVKKLQAQLDEAQALACRLRDSNNNKQVSHTHAQEQPKTAKDGNQDRVTEDDLNDDEALFKRHIARIADMKSMKTTSPIRITDVIRKNEVLIIENRALRQEVGRLKDDNNRLIVQAKRAWADRNVAAHHYGTSEAARRDLQKRLEKEQKQHKLLTRSLTRQASEWIQSRKQLQEMEEAYRWTSVGPVAELGSEERTYMHPVRKNVFEPRKMHPVEQWAGTS